MKLFIQEYKKKKFGGRQELLHSILKKDCQKTIIASVWI